MYSPLQESTELDAALSWTAVLVACAWVGMSGCNGGSDSLPVLKVYEVKGKVLLADGKPLSSGSVYLVPKGDLSVTPMPRSHRMERFPWLPADREKGRLPANTRSVSRPRMPGRAKSPRNPCPVQVHRRGQLRTRRHRAPRGKPVGSHRSQMTSRRIGPIESERAGCPGARSITCGCASAR